MTGSILKGVSCPNFGKKPNFTSAVKYGPNENAPQKKIIRCCCCPKKTCTPKKRRYCQPSIPESFAPRRLYQKPCGVMDDNTIYKMSYKPVKEMDLRSPITVHPGNLTLSCGKMSGDTVHKLSYLPNKIKLPKPFIPCDHDLTGKGPMQEVTTHRHDYVPKPNSVRHPYSYSGNLCNSKVPLSDKTVNKLSYAPPGIQAKPRSYAPIRWYEPPKGNMDLSTVHNLSYRPNPVTTKLKPAWAEKPTYKKPCGVMNGDTIYNLSYVPPGEDCESDDLEEPYCSSSENSIDCCPCPQEYVYECPRAAC